VVTLGGRRERIEQLAALLDGDLPEDEARPDVRRLASLAGTVTTEIAPPRLEDEERDRIRTRVMAAVHTDLQGASAPAPARSARSRRTAVATGLASVVIGASAVGVAAQEALPGDTLYGLKRATESVRIAAAGDLTDHGRLELRLAAERLEEVTAAVERGGVRDQDLIDTLQRMDERSVSGARTLVRVAERSGEAELLEEVARFTEQQASGLVEIIPDLPVMVRPHAEDSLDTLRAIRTELLAPLLGDGGLASAELAAAIDAMFRSSPLPGLTGPTGSGGTADEPVGSGSTERSGSPPSGDATTDPVPLPGTDTASGGGGTLDEAADTVRDIVDGIVDGGEQLLEDTVDEVGDTVDEVGDTVDEVGETVDEVGDTVGKTVNRTTEKTVDKVGETVDGTTGTVGDTTDAVDGVLGGDSLLD
jgi:methyl-accepting chemotaxis protein